MGTPLPGGMMDVPLTIGSILDHAVRNHPRKTIVSRDGDRFARFTYAEFGARVARLANVLRDLGIGPGDRVASFAWNTHRHLELYYAVPMVGAVLHTTNVRLFPEQVAYVFDHADDRVVFVDGSLCAVLAPALVASQQQRTIVTMGDRAQPIPGALDYETLLADACERVSWPEIDERQAAILCYTSATTGDPKAVAFSHRSTYIHALAVAPPDVFGLRERDVVVPFVPMFHVNAWGVPFVALMTGTTLVLAGSRLDPESVVNLLEQERATVALGVPTIWLGVRDVMRTRGRPPTLERLVIGGSAAPASLIDDLNAMGVRVIHAWGMTEMSPVGTTAYPTRELDAEPEKQRQLLYKQGKFASIVAWRIVDAAGNDVPADGRSRGELFVRGPAVAKEYFHNERATDAAFVDGWFRTGDVVTVDEYGYLEIVDRVKDLIKSGGEWISSVEVENALMSHPAVKEACVFGAPHPQWAERPVAAVVLRDGMTATPDDLQAWLSQRLAKWQIADRYIFLDAIPRTGVGKFLKRELRERYATAFAEASVPAD